MHSSSPNSIPQRPPRDAFFFFFFPKTAFLSDLCVMLLLSIASPVTSA
jgi:hypothetical protein